MKHFVITISLSLGCNELSLRLVGGDSLNVGRLEICIDGTWKTICRKLLSVSTDAAQVACRELGFSSTNTEYLYDDTPVGANPQPIWSKFPECTGRESVFSSCNFMSYESAVYRSCDHSHDLGIKCQPTGKAL